jgi:phosphoribosylglycinamide formyltransferase 1
VKKIAVFASGAGTNTAGIIHHFLHHPTITVSLIVSNKPDAAVLNIAASENVPSLVIEKEKFLRGNAYVDELKQAGIDWIVLAGFLWKIPDLLIHAWRGRIINIHPALLPKHGGKGMYGRFVHEAVINAGEKESGITIHFVDENYDNGDIIFQASCPVLENDTADSLAKRIRILEHLHYPEIIEKVVEG